MTTLAHISDLHFGRLDPAAAEALVPELHAARPDLVVVSGDLTQRARRAQFAGAMAWLARLPAPRLVVPGNHDVPLYDVLRRAFDPFGRFRRFAGDEPWPTWQNDEVFVLGLNTASRLAPRLGGFWKDGIISRPQRDELRRRFEPAGARRRVVVAHHPFIEPPGGHRHGIVHGARPALEALAACGVELILGGHIHKSYRGDVRAQHPSIARPIVNLLAGSATSTRRREPHNSYNLLRLEAGAMSVEVRAFVNGAWVTQA